jgi:D-xylose transport system permease protein
MAGWAMIAYGVVFVLLLGEIDLSIGYVSAVGGVSVAILLTNANVMEIVAAADVARAAGEPVSGLASSGPVVIYTFWREWSTILFPLVFGGGRLAWYFLNGAGAQPATSMSQSSSDSSTKSSNTVISIRLGSLTIPLSGVNGNIFQGPVIQSIILAIIGFLFS